MTTVRDAAFEVLRAHGLTRVFSNPGSTEVPLLSDFPDDFEFVLALHEGSVVGAATGFAIVRDRPALVLLHTTAGLGNAVGALATARVNRAPLVVLVGQQDRRHLAQEPFLTGRLAGLGGEYPVSVEQPVRAQDVPGALGRAVHAATLDRGPALVVVPSGDWAEPAEDLPLPAPREVREAAGVDETSVRLLAELVADADSPALVVGAGADDARTWTALVRLAERLRCPVWQESFGARAGFPQDHPQFAGHLPADRTRLRSVLQPFDVVLVVGAPVLRQYQYADGRLAEEGTRFALVTDDPAEARAAVADLAVVAPLPAACAALADALAERSVAVPRFEPRLAPTAPTAGSIRAAHVLGALAERLPPDVVVVEETPSSRPDLHALLPARQPLGFVSAAMGGLGFALPAAIGIRMGGDRPVVAVVGDGSSLYQIQALWTAAHYGVGVLFMVLANGRYAVMDRLAEAQGGKAPWPGFSEVSVTTLAAGLGCPARRVDNHAELLAELDAVVPTLADRREPLVLEVAVQPEPTFEP